MSRRSRCGAVQMSLEHGDSRCVAVRLCLELYAKYTSAAKIASSCSQIWTREFFNRGHERFGKRGCRTSCAASCAAFRATSCDIARNITRNITHSFARNIKPQHHAREKLTGEIVKHDADPAHQNVRLSRGTDVFTISSGGRGVSVYLTSLAGIIFLHRILEEIDYREERWMDSTYIPPCHHVLSLPCEHVATGCARQLVDNEDLEGPLPCCKALPQDGCGIFSQT